MVDMSTHARAIPHTIDTQRTRMFVDMEASSDQAYVWLISVLVAGKPDSFRLFYAETLASEGDILNDFLSYRKEFGSYTICHYGGFDEHLIRRQITTYGLDYSNIGRWFDLQDSINKNGILLPSELSLSLKRVVGHFGYEFRHQDVDEIKTNKTCVKVHQMGL